MSLRRRLLGFSAVATGRLRRCSLSTATASHPPWAMFDFLSVVYKSEPPAIHLAAPPRYSYLQLPAHLINTSPEPSPESEVKQLVSGMVSSSSGADGLLLVTVCDARLESPILAQQGNKQVRQRTGKGVEGHVPDYTYLVCNPLSGQVLRVPNVGGTTKILRELRMGFLTQADRGHGPPDRFAVAQLYSGNNMVRFLSETGKWELVNGAPSQCQLPRLASGIGAVYQDTLAFGGWLWYVDVGCGAVTVDPFSDRTETRFVELPKGSVLPHATKGGTRWASTGAWGSARGGMPRCLSRSSSFVLDEDCGGGWTLEHRVALSSLVLDEDCGGGWTLEHRVALSSLVLDEDCGGGWTLEHRVALSRVLADGGDHPWLPLRGTPHIAVLDPLDASVMHLTVGEHIVAVDMDMGKVMGSSPKLGCHVFSHRGLDQAGSLLQAWTYQKTNVSQTSRFIQSFRQRREEMQHTRTRLPSNVSVCVPSLG